MNKQSKFITGVVFETLKTLELVMGETSAEERKKMAGADAKAFNAVRQTNKKTLAQYADRMERQSGAVEAGEGQKKKLGEEILVPKVIEMTPENVLRKLQEVVGSRGRKHADKQENLATLKKLYSMALNDRHRIQVLVGTIASEFDMVVPSLGYLALETWAEAIDDTERLIGLLKGCTDAASVVDAEAEELGLPGHASLQGSLFSFTQRLDDEFTKALQIIDPNTAEYEEFLRAEQRLYAVLEQARGYFSSSEEQSLVLMRQLEHLYFRPQSVIVHLQAGTRTVAEMANRLYQSPSEKLRVRALLCHVYHLALHGQYCAARDIFVGSHVAEHLGALEVATQILYNRTVVQLGLAAFQRGLLKESYFALQEICSSGRPRELLAQGLQSQKYIERTPEQERTERQRQLPHHMHLSIELIDSVFLTVSMLLEIPQAAAAARRFFRVDKKLFPSRHLRRLIDSHDRNLFNGPPENTRDFIISAAKALAHGNWRTCLQLILQSKLWTLFPAPKAIAAMLERKIKEAALCIFTVAFGPTYTSLSLDFLAEKFDLPLHWVQKILDRLVQEHSLPARIEDAAFLVWSQDTEISPVQELVLQIRDKLSVLVERNHEAADIMAAATA